MAEITYSRLIERQIKSNANQWWRSKFYPWAVKLVVIILVLIVCMVLTLTLSIYAVFGGKSADTVNNLQQRENAVLLTDFPDRAEWQTRVDLATAAYKSGKVSKIYVIGDSTRSADLVAGAIPAIDVIVMPDEYRISNACRRLRREYFVTKLLWATDKSDQFTLSFLCTREGIDTFVLTNERVSISNFPSQFSAIISALHLAFNN